MNEMMNEEQARLQEEFKKIIQDVFTPEDAEKATRDFEKEAKSEKTKTGLLREMAYAERDSRMAQLAQSNYFMDYDLLRHRELEHIKTKREKLFNKELKQKQNLIKEQFKRVRINEIKRVVFHKELEKRIGFEFEVGQGGYMSAYLGALIGGK